MDAGDETIEDERELEQVRAQSTQVYIRSALAAAIVAAVLIAI